MTNRTAIIMGKATTLDPEENSVNLAITLNNSVVFDGTVTANDVDPGVFNNELCRFDFPVDWQDNISIALTPTGGTVIWEGIHTNFTGSLYEFVSFKDTAVWPAHVPATIDELRFDLESLSHSEFDEKYGHVLLNNNVTKVTVLDSSLRFQTINQTNTVESDGRDNIHIDGVPQSMDLDARRAGVIGDWGWTVNSGQTITADISFPAPLV